MKHSKGTMIISTITLVALATAGCSAGKDTAQPASSQAATASATPDTKLGKEPVALTLYNMTSETDTLINKNIKSSAEKKFPGLTITVIQKAKGSMLEDLIASGSVPDLIITPTPTLSGQLLDDNVLFDLHPLIKKYNFDVSKVNPAIMDSIKIQGNKGETFALPLYNNSMFLTYYNKDIFNKFGVDYPKDGMFWDDYLELQKRLTRTAENIQYRGIDPITFQYGHPGYSFMKPGKDEPDLLNDNWVNQFKMFAAFYQVPGSQRKLKGEHDWKKEFLEDHTTAMLAYRDYIQTLIDLEKSGNGMNWDIATYPSYKDAPGVGLAVDSHDLAISPTSKHPDEAFQVIAFLLSKENQLEMAKDGKLSALTDPEMQANFGKNIPGLQGKNVAAIFKIKPFPLQKLQPHEGIVTKDLNAQVGLIPKGNFDVITLLRTAQENAIRDIAAAKK